MRVKHCYIVGFGKNGNDIDDETGAVCGALFTKYSARCQETKVFHHNNVVEVSASTGVNAVVKHEVGIYLVFHTFAGMFLEIDAGRVYDFVAKVIPDQQLKAAEKVALVACDSADLGEGDLVRNVAVGNLLPEPTDDFDDLGRKRSILLQIMLAFDAHGVRPKVAGWDDFISAAPYLPTGNSLYPTPKGGGKSTIIKNINEQQYVGKKIGHGKRYGFVDDTYRSAHKRVYYIENGIIHVDGLAGWSDK